MLRPIAFALLLAASFVPGLSVASAQPIPLDPSAVRWRHIELPANDDQRLIIDAIPTAGTVVYDNITTWRRGLNPVLPDALGYQGPGNDPEIWTSDDLHFGPEQTRFNEVHFVIRTFQNDRPLTLGFWPSDADLSWPDPAVPAPMEFSLSLPEMAPSEGYSTLVTITLPFDIDYGSDIWMGMQSIVENVPHEQIAISSGTPAVGWSADWWSQVPGHQMQFPPFFSYPNNFAYGLSYVVPGPSLGLPLGVLALAMVRRRRSA